MDPDESRNSAEDNDDVDGLPPDEIRRDPEKNYMLKYFRERVLPRLRDAAAVAKTVSDHPWIDEESFGRFSYAQKYLDYRTHEHYIDPENPFAAEDSNDIRKRDRKRRKKDSSSDNNRDFGVIEEGIREIGAKKPDQDDNKDDDDSFLDEFGNIISEEEERPKSKAKSGWIDRDQIDSGEEKPKEAPPVKRKIHPENPVQAPKYAEPRKSALDAGEQRDFLRLQRRFCGMDHARISALNDSAERNQYYYYLEQREFLKNERAEFQNFVKSISIDRIGRIANDPVKHRSRREMIDFGRKVTARKVTRALKTYPRHYKSLEVIPLISSDLKKPDEKPQFQLRPSSPFCLLEFGVMPRVFRLSPAALTQRLKSMEGNRVYKGVDTKLDVVALDEAADDDDVGVSVDQNARMLAEKFRPHVVIEVSALKAIFDNFGPKYDLEWEIPVSLKNNTLFVDKPLPKKNPTEKDLIQLWYKKAAKKFLQSDWNQSSTKAVNLGAGKEMEMTFAGSHDYTECDTFGSDDPPTFVPVTPSVNKKEQGEKEKAASFLESDLELSSESGEEDIKQVDGCDDGGDDEDDEGLIIDAASENSANDESGDTKTYSELTRGSLPMRMSQKVTVVNMDIEKGQVSVLKSDMGLSSESSEEVVKQVDGCDDGGDDDDEESLIIDTASENSANDAASQKSGDTKNNSKITEAGPPKRMTTRSSAKTTSNVVGDILATLTSTSQRRKGRPNEKRHDFSAQANNFVEIYNGEYLTTLEPSLEGMRDEFRRPKAGSNVKYRCWNLWNKENPDKSALRLIIRSKVDGFNAAKKPRRGDSCRLSFSTHVERHERKFGASRVPKSQLAREWVSALAKESKLCRLRVSEEDNEVVLMEVLGLKEILGDKEHQFKPAEVLGNLYAIFASFLTHFKEDGDYLLQHDAKTAAFVRVLKAATEPAADYDLEKAFKEANSVPSGSIPFNPIDFDVITPWHELHQRPPGLFAPPIKHHPEQKPAKNGGKKRGQRGRGRGRGRGRKH